MNMITGGRHQDDSYIKELFHRYYRPLCYYISKYIPEPDVADDICQDLFVKLWKRLDNFDSIHKIESFLFVSARNACLNELDRISRKQKNHERFNQEHLEAAVDEAVMAKEFDQMLSAWLEALPEKCRQVVQMALTGVQNEEIALRMDISVNTVKNQKVKGFKMLREMCSEHFFLVLVYALLFNF